VVRCLCLLVCLTPQKPSFLEMNNHISKEEKSDRLVALTVLENQQDIIYATGIVTCPFCYVSMIVFAQVQV
jgi:hypothetical protein